LVKNGFGYEAALNMPMAEIMTYLDLLAKPPPRTPAPGAQRYVAKRQAHGA
jgi:hypothetical protein